MEARKVAFLGHLARRISFDEARNLIKISQTTAYEYKNFTNTFTKAIRKITNSFDSSDEESALHRLHESSPAQPP
jgi:hypothetical protein